MHKKLLRSVLVAAFSVLVAVGASSGFAKVKQDVRADSAWPLIAPHVVGAKSGAVS
ncbi:hypothetical protein [Streptomyces sp. NPDC005573]|uniref:hypothetical protein n=1 Tax=unclassified Streptomyces TaxID=2593676 RepID=UPI0033AB319A